MALHKTKKGSDYAFSVKLDHTLSFYVDIRVSVAKNGAPDEILEKFSKVTSAGYVPIVVTGDSEFACYIPASKTLTAKEGIYRVILETKEANSNTSSGTWTELLSANLVEISIA